jgi:hypothetical protein
LNFYHLYLRREWLFSKVFILKSGLTGDPLGRVHDQELLQQEESLAVGLDPMPIHIFDQGTVLVAAS